jgi:2'-5' RNA ligase
MVHTLLAVPVPAADPLVRRLTAEWEASYELGGVDEVHAHVTVLGPLIPVEAVDDQLHATLRRMYEATAPFDFRLEEVGVFTGTAVYLAPDPARRFAKLTADAVKAFPSYPPYGGKFDNVVPHMTLGPIWSPEMERALVAAGTAAVPIEATATEVRLILNDHKSFHTIGQYPLGG